MTDDEEEEEEEEEEEKGKKKTGGASTGSSTAADPEWLFPCRAISARSAHCVSAASAGAWDAQENVNFAWRQLSGG